MLAEVASSLFDTFIDTDRLWIRYRRGGSSAQVQALPGRTDHEVSSSDGGTRTARTADFIVRAADLMIGGTAVLPIRGQDAIDVLDGKDGAVVATYMVTHPGGQEAYRFSDQYHGVMRIHTVLKD